MHAGSTGSGDIGVEIFESEIELILVEALEPASELAALQDLNEVAEPVDLGLSLGALMIALRHTRVDHFMQCSDVGLTSHHRVVRVEC